MKLVKKFLTENKCYKVYRKHTPVGIFLHSVGCPQPSADVFVKNWNTYQPGGSSVCVHGFISDKVAYQTLPWDCTSWHSGQGKVNNASHILFVVQHEVIKVFIIIASKGKRTIHLSNVLYRLTHLFCRE